MSFRNQVGLWLLATIGAFAGAAPAQITGTSHLARMDGFTRHWKAQLGPKINRLSASAQTLFLLSEQREKFKAIGAAIGKTGGVAESLSRPKTKLMPRKPASAPNISFTRFSGAVQSETSTAWCGKQAVVGFKDSDSILETGGGLSALFDITDPTSGFSFNSFAVSTNSGGSFTDKGSLTVGPIGTFLEGDPVLACTDPSNFFYSSLYFDGSLPGPTGNGATDVSLSRSTDGGITFSAPVAAVAKDAFFHFLDKDWMTVNEANADIFITYTDFDASGTGACGLILRTAIELVRSTDGGATWSSPKVVVQVCGAPFVQGSQVVVDPASGNVYVAWESFESDFYSREIDIAKSTDGGVTFSGPVKVSAVHPVGDGNIAFGLQGFISDFEYPSLTTGKGKKNAGTLYITWNDGDNRVLDAWVDAITTVHGIGDGKYGFSDIFFSSSSDGGSTWSSPVAVNAPSSAPADHYQPGAASDKSGKLAVCWYDRRRDKNNFRIDRFCGKSTNGGATWSNTKITASSYSSVVNQDLLMPHDYMGDYDQLTSEATNSRSGFLGGFVNTQTGNQNVQVNKF